MADGDNKNKVEIEVAIRDMFSTTLKTMGRELDALNKRATETGVSGAGGFDKFRRSNDQLTESNKRTTASFSAMSVVTSTLTRGLLGTAGLAYGFYSVSKAIEDVSVNAIKLKNFSTDTGFAISKVQDLQQTLRLGGFSKSEGDSVIGAMGSMANNLAAFKESSDIYQKLILAPGGAALATNLVNIAKTGDQAKVVSEFLKVFSRQSREAKFFMAEAAGTTISALEAMANTANKNRHVKLWPIDQEEANKMHELWLDMEDNFTNIFTNISNHGIKAFNELTQAFTAQGVTTRGIAAWVNNETDQLFATIRQTMDEIKSIREWYDSVSKGGEEGKKAALNTPTIGKQPFGSNFDFLNKTPADFLRGGRKEGAYPQGEDPMGKDYTARGISSYLPKWLGGNKDAVPTSGSDGVNILTDIRDTLQRIEIGNSGVGSGGSGGGGTYGTGIRTEGGAMKGGLGGFRGLTSRGGGGGGKGGGRGGFRGGRSGGGASGSTGEGRDSEAMPTSDADLEGAKGSEFLQKQRQSRIDEINNDPVLKENVLKMLQLEETSVSGKTAAMEALLNRSIMTGNTIKKELFSGFYGPINRGGLNKELGGAARRTSSTAFDSAAGGSNIIQSRTDQGMVGDPNAHGPGRIRVPGTTGIFNDWKGRRNGQEFTHEDSRIWRENQERQISAGGDARNSGMMDANRASIDKAQASDKWTKGGINAKVEFLNVPPGVRTNADVEGDVFKDLQISKTKQSGVYRQTGQSYD